jgi:hypothetical protein
MTLQAIVSSLALVVAPPAGTAPAVPAGTGPALTQAQIWNVAVGLSAGVVYRMDSMPARLHQPGAEFLQESLQLAKRLRLPVPDDPVLKGPEADTLAAMGYVMGASDHPTAKFLAERQGRAAAALFEFGLLSHVVMTAVEPSSENAKMLADQMESAARDTGLARDTWGGFVDALKKGKTRDAAKDALPDMLKVVARACPR